MPTSPWRPRQVCDKPLTFPLSCRECRRFSRFPDANGLVADLSLDFSNHLDMSRWFEINQSINQSVNQSINQSRTKLFRDTCHGEFTGKHLGVGAQSTLGARHCCPKNMYEKLTKCPNFRWFVHEKFPTCRLVHYNCTKNIFPNLGGGARCSCPPFPTPLQGRRRNGRLGFTGKRRIF